LCRQYLWYDVKVEQTAGQLLIAVEATENAGPENDGRKKYQKAENAGLENDGLEFDGPEERAIMSLCMSICTH